MPITLVRILQQLSQERADKRIDTDQWEEAFTEALAKYHTAAYSHGAKLPPRKLTPADYAMIQGVLDKQREYLKGFGNDWDSGRYDQSARAAISRSALYADATTGSWWMGATRGLLLPAWPGDGTTQCRTRCNCSWHIVYLGSPGAGNVDAYWQRGGGSDHCQTCDQRGEDWSPLEIREGELQLKSYSGIRTKGWVTIHGHPVFLGADKGSAGGGGGGGGSLPHPGKDPRYDTAVERLPLAKTKTFAEVTTRLMDDPDMPGVQTERPFAEAFQWDAKPAGTKTFKPSEVVAIQDYYTAENLSRLMDIPASERPLPKVFTYEGKNYLMDGTHRVLVNNLEVGHKDAPFEAEHYVVPK